MARRSAALGLAIGSSATVGMSPASGSGAGAGLSSTT